MRGRTHIAIAIGLALAGAGAGFALLQPSAADAADAAVRHTLAASGTAASAAAARATASTSTSASERAPSLPSTALTVEVTTPQPMTMARTFAASGSIAARDELIVGSDAQGLRLVQVLVDTGSAVKRGQLLALADDAQLQAQLAQQDALIRQARAELAQADANLERAERIKDSGVYSEEAVQTRRTAAEAAAAKLQLAQAQKRELEVRLSHTRVLAPADGVLSRRAATVGAVVQPGMELFRLIRDDEIEWRAELPDRALAAIRPGATVRVMQDDTRSVEGRVRLVAPTVDARTRNGVIHVSLPRGTPLKPGAHVQGELHIGSTSVWTLPEAALLSRDGQAFVYLIGSDGSARAVRISTGARQQGRVEVMGLPTDARVVATGAGFVKDGERVRVAAPSTSSTPNALYTATQGGRS